MMTVTMKLFSVKARIWKIGVILVFLTAVGCSKKKPEAADREKYFEEARRKYEAAEDDRSRFYALWKLVRGSIMTRRRDEAKRRAEEILVLKDKFVGDWNYGNAVEIGHVALGAIALADEDIAAAKAHLIEAGKGTTSPQIMTMGPDFSLARAILKKGEKEAVLEYLTLCEKKWKAGKEQLVAWREEIGKGKSPDFKKKLNDVNALE